MIDINMTLVAQIFNFLILVAILYKVAYKPLLKVLDERSAKIANHLQAAEAEQKAAEKLKADYQKELVAARIQAQEIVDKAIKAAAEEREASLAQTKAQTAQMIKTAREEIEREQAKAISQVRGEVIAISMAAATKIIGGRIDASVDEKLIEDFIEKLDKEKIGGLPC